MLKKVFILILPLLLVACAQQPKSTPAPTEVQAILATSTSSSDSPEKLKLDVKDEPHQNLGDDAVHRIHHLWQKIAVQRQIEVPERAAVTKYRDFYQKNRSFIAQASKRAEPFLYFMLAELEKRQMPLELALLPMVESGFNPRASAGAPVGLWQMVPQTASKFGLTRNQWLDQRQDPVLSTLAALDYLQYLYQLLGQDWITAVAGYNAGEGRVQAAIAKNQKNGLATDFWSLKIPEKSTTTVPKWLALIDLIQKNEHYNLPWHPISMQTTFSFVDVTGPMPLTDIAVAADISTAELKLLNPAFRRDIVPPGSQKIILPVAATAAFDKKRHLLKPIRLAETVMYKVQSGDSLSRIASRNGLSVKQLKQLNGLKTDRLAVGQTLLLASTTEQVTAGFTELTQVTPPLSYRVKSGDVLSNIAKRNKLKLADLLKWNGLTADTMIRPGQILKLAAPD